MRPNHAPTMLEIWTDHYDSLDEERRILFLLSLKQRAYVDMDDDALKALGILGERWITEAPSK